MSAYCRVFIVCWARSRDMLLLGRVHMAVVIHTRLQRLLLRMSCSRKTCAMVWCSGLYTTKHVAMQLASCIGPIVSIIFFLFLGNEWKVSPLACLSVPAHSISNQHHNVRFVPLTACLRMVGVWVELVALVYAWGHPSRPLCRHWWFSRTIIIRCKWRR